MRGKLAAENVREALAGYPLPASRFVYGTSGFRTAGELLPAPSFRVGFVTALRSIAHSGKAVGIMVTASHNAHHDNGLKIVDASASMLEMSWEPLATAAANAKTLEEFLALLDKIMSEDCGSTAEHKKPRVHIGCDTRATSDAIVTAVVHALKICGAVIINHGVLTTPQLHAMVFMDNHRSYWPSIIAPDSSPMVDDYYNMINDAAGTLFGLCSTNSAKKRIVVDCANGVGSVAMRELLARAPNVSSRFEIILVNTSTENATILNHQCGADHVQKSQTAPVAILQHVDENAAAFDGVDASFYSLDGDADRLVALAFSPADDKGLRKTVLLDGDRICILLAVLIREMCHKNGLPIETADIGVVQTAYANGASTAYVASALNLKTYCTATGVKYLHPVAEERDIGLYFEANGHGTVLFHHKFLQKHGREHSWLIALSRLLSQCCGDALCDLIAVEFALAYLGWSAQAWLDLYHDLPSLQTKVIVRDPSVITNTEDQRRALSPAGLQEAIDLLVAGANDPSARSFVRPSGTEPIVRTYTEAANQESVKKLSLAVEDAVRKFCQ
jgi:phosphoacetylglucosamine mutase